MGEQKIHFIAYNMKLQFIFLASTLALTYSKNIPVPELNKETEKNVKQLTNTAVRKTQNFLKANGVEIKSLRQRLDNALNAGVPQLNAVKNEADESVGGLINFVSGELNKAIDGAENDVPDGAKSALDILQGVLGAVKDAGVAALGDNANKSIEDLANAGSDALQNSANGAEVNNAIKNA